MRNFLLALLWILAGLDANATIGSDLLRPALSALVGGDVPTICAGKNRGGGKQNQKKKANPNQNKKQQKKPAAAAPAVAVKPTVAKKTMGDVASQRLTEMDTASMSAEQRDAYEKERQRTVASQFTADLADQQRFRDQLKTLKLTPATINQPQADGELLLHTAVRHNWQLAVEDLLAKGADPTLKDMGGNTAIDIARMVSDARMVQILSAAAPKSP